VLRVVPFDSIVVPESRSVIFDRVQRRRSAPRNPIAQLDGLWKGRLHDAAGGRNVPFALLNSVPERGNMVARLSFNLPKSEPITLDLLEASAFAYVVVTEAYIDPLSGRLVLSSFEGRWAKNRLWGAYLTRPLAGGEATIGRFSAVRVEVAGW
jgi:hypothetical protein